MKLLLAVALLFSLAESFKIYLNQGYPLGLEIEYFKFDSHLGTTFNQAMPYYLEIPIPIGAAKAYVNIESKYNRGLLFSINQKGEDYLRANMTWICPEWLLGIAFNY